MKALPLDDVPAVKVYLGLPLFGARAPAAGEASIAQRQSEDYGARLFEPVVLGAAGELPAIVTALRHRQCLGPNEPIGLFGFSAGGTAALVALADRKVAVRLAVVVSAPTGLDAAIDALEHATHKTYAWSSHTRQLADRSDAIRNAARIASGAPALLIMQGEDDSVVNARGAMSLDEALRPLYRRGGHDRRLKVVLAPGVSHDWTEPNALPGLRATVTSWLNSYL